jgi:hypothetical protein
MLACVRNCTLAAGFICLLPGTSLADPRREIESAYQRLSRAWNLKYVDGIMSVRTPQFRLIDTEGSLISEDVERQRLESLFGSSLSVSDQVKILDFRPEGSGTVVCRVSYLARSRRMTKDPKQLVLWTFEQNSQDSWKYLDGKWKMYQCRVTSVKQAIVPSK